MLDLSNFGILRDFDTWLGRAERTDDASLAHMSGHGFGTDGHFLSLSLSLSLSPPSPRRTDTKEA